MKATAETDPMKLSTAARDPVVELDLFAKHLAALTGLSFPPARAAVLRRAVEAVLAEHPEASALLRKGMPLPAPVRHRLIELSTIGETYFFRDSDQLDELQRLVLTPLVTGRQVEGQLFLRAWSAGCATGEEVYTVAALIGELIGMNDRWDIRIVGSDIDTSALSSARRGTYDRWSFRSALGSRERWFTSMPHATSRRVLPRLLPWVRFVEHNLAALDLAPPPELDRPADLVLMRNVLLYLDPAARQRAIATAYVALRPGGWLVVAPVDLSAASFDGFERVALGRGIALRRALPSADRTPRPERRSAGTTIAGPPSMATTSKGKRDARTRRHEGPLSCQKPARMQQPDADPLANAWRLADAGELQVAIAAARAAQIAAPDAPAPAVCLAMLADAAGDVALAHGFVRQALAAAPNHAGANLQLALLELRSGRSRAALARLRTVLRLIRSLPGESPLPDLPGTTANDVRWLAGALVRPQR